MFFYKCVQQVLISNIEVLKNIIIMFWCIDSKRFIKFLPSNETGCPRASRNSKYNEMKCHLVFMYYWLFFFCIPQKCFNDLLPCSDVTKSTFNLYSRLLIINFTNTIRINVISMITRTVWTITIYTQHWIQRNGNQP